jgi:hypothetical protein
MSTRARFRGSLRDTKSCFGPRRLPTICEWTFSAYLAKGIAAMADDTTTTPASDFPAPQFPTVFADGVMSIANSPSVVKFYLFRYDPSFSGSGQSRNQSFAQVIMPMDAFAATFALFERAVTKYIEQDLITKERLDTFREIYKNVEFKVS